jgi:hypothetical protein
MMSIETLAGFLDDELERAIERLRSARRDIDRDLAALRAERKRRRTEPPKPPPVDSLAELLRRPDYYMHVFFRAGYERLKAPPKDRPSLAIVEIDRFQYTATYDDTRGRFVSPPACYYGINDWTIVGRRDGSTFFRRPKRPPPFELPLDYIEPGFISNKEWREKMGIPDGEPT